jgi:hypothetical protein
MSQTSPSYKFVVAVNKTVEPGVAFNAVAHVSLGLSAKATLEQREHMHFISFVDGSGIFHDSISALSLIVLRATNGELKKLVQAAQEQQILSVDFLQTMTGDTYVEQLEKTKSTVSDALIYYAVGLFGLKEVIDPLTKKLSLWK